MPILLTYYHRGLVVVLQDMYPIPAFPKKLL